MKALTIADAEQMIMALQDEIRRSEKSRYDHRLHGVLLVAQGLSCSQVGSLLGDGPRTVEYWVHRFENDGFAGLAEGERPGRPTRLSAEQMAEIDRCLRLTPQDCGLQANLWDGKALAALIEHKFRVQLCVRQCQRLFRQLGFRLRKPRPLVGHPDPEIQQAHKKTPRPVRRSRRGPLGDR